MPFTFLAASMATLVVAVVLGIWLSALWLLREEPPRGPVLGWIHGSAGLATIALVYCALAGVRADALHPRGAGGFGWTGFVIGVLALLGGAWIFVQYRRGRQPGVMLIALHACAGITAAVTLAAYYANPTSFGR